ncbi:mab-21 protein domain-containing protein [Phthorimaea operculella]|nr:mab-21 protein domain-containing protein [Phthorimaea operculella]
MGNSKSKKVQKEPDRFFEREKWKEHKREEKKKFFENYERELHHIKNNPISEREHLMDEAMVRRHKHVFFADRLQECVHEHVTFQRRRGQPEPLAAPRLYVIYDNVEASEPGDTSDYSAVLDAPFYKLQIEDCKEQGYVKLKKLEVLESTSAKESEDVITDPLSENDIVYTDSERESNDSDESPYLGKGEELLQKLESKLIKSRINDGFAKNKNLKLNDAPIDLSTRRASGPVKLASLQVQKSNINNIKNYQKRNEPVAEEKEIEKKEPPESNGMPRKSILKSPRRPSGPFREEKTKPLSISDVKKVSTENTIAEDTETSGYTSSKSETESDYGYSTITESTKPKKLELSIPSNMSANSGALPDECWSTVQVRAFDNWSEDEDDDDTASKSSLSRNLYESYHYLDSFNFMNNFVDNFIINLGSGLGLSQDAINNALTQGASIYCDTIKNGMKLGTEVFPALIAAWPNAANQWIIRERKIIQNPRTNFTYQWPTKYMVNKAIGFGCLLIPVGFRPKRGINPEQVLQWKIVFPAAERYLESCLAHSHMRCYLFALALQKTFLNNETCKIGVDASHIKNHLFWQCEDNYAKWPEDRLGETLRLFLRSFYVHFGQGRFPNYFIDSCNDFKSIPKPLLLKQQRRLADILESPVVHLLSALDKLKYTKKDFYPAFNSIKLYDILTCKNPLRLLNPNIPVMTQTQVQSSDSEDEDTSFWDKTKDKQYQWKKERQRQIQERRKAQTYIRKQKPAASKPEREFNTRFCLPAKMDTERRRLVLEFFISHFIAMARSSERFDAIKQAVIYLEQAQRLCILLLDEPGGDFTANGFFEVIRDKLADCQRKLVNQGGFKLPPRRESQVDRVAKKPMRVKPLHRHIMASDQDSPTDASGAPAFTFVDVHVHNQQRQNDSSDDDDGEESRL